MICDEILVQLTNDDSQTIQALEAWIVRLLRDEPETTYHYIQINGDQRTGKSMLRHLLTRLLGRARVVGQPRGDYWNDILEHARVVAIGEYLNEKEVKRYSNWVGKQLLPIHGKGRMSKVIENRIRWIQEATTEQALPWPVLQLRPEQVVAQDSALALGVYYGLTDDVVDEYKTRLLHQWSNSDGSCRPSESDHADR